MDHASFTIAGEFATLADARASGIEADGILIADLKGPRRADSGAGRAFAWPADALPRRQPGRRIENDDEEFEEPLTPREIDVVELLAEGLSNKAIAARLGISDQTVKFHVASICGKLGAANRTDAVRRAVRRGLISL
jgi:DNA-binding NarL/FixJ family response regulator